MTLTIAITLIVLFDVVLIAGLAHVMSHATKLTPHQPGLTGNHWRLHRPVRPHHSSAHAARGERVPARLASALE